MTTDTILFPSLYQTCCIRMHSRTFITVSIHISLYLIYHNFATYDRYAIAQYYIMLETAMRLQSQVQYTIEIQTDSAVECYEHQLLATPSIQK